MIHVDAIDAFVPQEKTIFYHKCKVEQYAPYTQDDGLIQRITLYKDHSERNGQKGLADGRYEKPEGGF